MGDLIEALEATGLPFAAYGWIRTAPELSRDHGVYALDDDVTLRADGEHAERAYTGTVDYFTRDPSGAPQQAVEAALEAGAFTWELNSVQYEQDTGFIHYEWEFSVLSR